MRDFLADRWSVTLPDRETRLAVSEGLLRVRRHFGQEQRFKSWLGDDVQHIVGALGEVALAWYSNTEWTGRISHKSYDVDGWIEVRATPRDNAWLTLRPDKANYQPEKPGPYVCASVNDQTIELCGWYDLDEGRVDKFWDEDRWVIKELNPMWELRQHPLNPRWLDPTRSSDPEMKMPIRREANRHPLGEAGIG